LALDCARIRGEDHGDSLEVVTHEFGPCASRDTSAKLRLHRRPISVCSPTRRPALSGRFGCGHRDKVDLMGSVPEGPRRAPRGSMRERGEPRPRERRPERRRKQPTQPITAAKSSSTALLRRP